MDRPKPDSLRSSSRLTSKDEHYVYNTNELSGTQRNAPRKDDGHAEDPNLDTCLLLNRNQEQGSIAASEIDSDVCMATADDIMNDQTEEILHQDDQDTGPHMQASTAADSPAISPSRDRSNSSAEGDEHSADVARLGRPPGTRGRPRKSQAAALLAEAAA